jgi:hypothetical protein
LTDLLSDICFETEAESSGEGESKPAFLPTPLLIAGMEELFQILPDLCIDVPFGHIYMAAVMFPLLEGGLG